MTGQVTTWGEVRRGQWVRTGRDGKYGTTWEDSARVVRWDRNGSTCMVTLELLPAPGARGGRGAGGLRTCSYRADSPVTVIG